MLLEYMRKKTKTFLYVIVPLIVISFVFWGTIMEPGQQQGEVLIEIGDKEINYQEFLDYYYNMRRAMEANFGGNLTPEIEEMLNLKQQALDEMIRETLLERQVERLGITISDEEVQDSLKRYPQFQTEDEFDPAKWNAAIGNPRVNWVGVAEQERRSLRAQRLVEMIQMAARVADDEIKEEYRRQNEKVEIEFVTLKTNDLLGDVEITDEEIAAYYEGHKDEYLEPAKVELAFVEFMKEPSQTDFDDAEQHCRRILERVQAGDDFAELAEYYSDDTSTKGKGGDLDFFGRGRMQKEFEEAAFALQPGQISEIVKTVFGYHIIKVEETRGEGDGKEVRARHILVKVEPGEDTLVVLEEDVLRLVGAAAKSSLEQAAEQMGLTMSTTPEFSESSTVIPGIGLVREITEILPGLREGIVSDRIEGKKAFYVVQVTKRTPERIQELGEVETRVKAAVKANKALSLAKARAEEIVSSVNKNGLKLANIDGLPEIERVEPFTRDGYAPGLPYVAGLTSVAFSLEEGKAAGPFVSGDSVYVIAARGRSEADPEGYEAEKDSIGNRILQRRRMQVFNDYYEDLREKAGVKINEELFEAT